MCHVSLGLFLVIWWHRPVASRISRYCPVSQWLRLYWSWKWEFLIGSQSQLVYIVTSRPLPDKFQSYQTRKIVSIFIPKLSWKSKIEWIIQQLILSYVSAVFIFRWNLVKIWIWQKILNFPRFYARASCLQNQLTPAKRLTTKSRIFQEFWQTARI